MASAKQKQAKRAGSAGDIQPLKAEDSNDDRDSYIQAQREKLMAEWLGQLPYWYPQLDSKTFFVPPIHINKAAHESLSSAVGVTTSVADRKASVKRVTEERLSDFRDDSAQLAVERLLWNVSRLLGEKEVMVVLTKFSLDNYLNKTLSGQLYVGKKRGKKDKDCDTKVKHFFPTPTQPELERGDFDVLIVHKVLGFIVIEIKSVGDLDIDGVDGHLTKQISSVREQLDKRQQQLMSVTSDIQGGQIPVKKLAAFPNVTRDMLKAVMQNLPHSSSHGKYPIERIGCEDDLGDAPDLWLCKEEVSEDSTNDIQRAWWTRLTEATQRAKPSGFTGIDDDAYTHLVARLCGPMSTVEICRPSKRDVHEARDLGDAAYEMGTCCKMWVLREEQLNWYNCRDLLVYLTGPPGSGKTLLLLVNAVKWVRDGDVVVVVRGPGNLPGHLVSLLLYSQIVGTLGDASLASNVYLKTIDAWTDPEEFVRVTKEGVQAGKRLMFLVDELWLANPSKKFLGLVREVRLLLDDQKKNVESLLVPMNSGCPAASEPHPKATVLPAPSVSVPKRPAPEAQDGITEPEVLAILMDLIRKTEKLSTVHDSAMVVLTEEVKGELEKLSSVAEDTQRLCAQARHSRCQDLSTALRNIGDADFYVDVLTSWLTSPVLHRVMQEARGHDNVGLWCTGFWANRCPDGYQLGQLSTSIRCPPHVQQLLDQTEQLASHQDFKLYSYKTRSTDSNPPLPAEGPPSALLTCIDHGQHVQLEKDTELDCLSQCAQCGQELASLLVDILHVDSTGKLRPRDVLIVGRALLPIKPDSEIVVSLEKRGIPTSVVVTGSDDLQPDDPDPDAVLVTNTYNGHGLERAVVVFVPDLKHCSHDGCEGSCGESGGDGGYMERLGEVNKMGLWFIASRCLGHVVIFHV